MRHLLTVLVCVFASQVFAAGTPGYVCDQAAIKKIKQGDLSEMKSASYTYIAIAQAGEIAKEECDKNAVDSQQSTLPEIRDRLIGINMACKIAKDIYAKLHPIKPCLDEAGKWVKDHS